MDLVLKASVHYPVSTGEMLAWFRTDADCLDYLAWLRWPSGFVCSRCNHDGGWRLGDGRFECGSCRRRTSVAAGTILDRTRTPLTVRFMACWLVATQKDGISAQSLQRTLEIGSYQTAWAMLARLRSVLVDPGRERLSGIVEVDETFIGGTESGLVGGRARGKKSLVGVAVELKEPKGYGRCRMAPLADASAASLRAFLADHVEAGATVVTDGWQGYHGIGEKRRSRGTCCPDRSEPDQRIADPDSTTTAAHTYTCLDGIADIGGVHVPDLTSESGQEPHVPSEFVAQPETSEGNRRTDVIVLWWIRQWSKSPGPQGAPQQPAAAGGVRV
jgi:hypothetical protein